MAEAVAEGPAPVVAQFELAGVEAGKTVNKGGFTFVNGVYEHRSHDTDTKHLATFLERSYYAFPVGSQALKDAQARYEREQKTGKTEETPDTTTAQLAESEQPNNSIKEAIEQLDHENDDHWTSAGLPSLTVVEDLAGEKVTRQQAETSAPGYTRAAAKAAASL